MNTLPIIAVIVVAFVCLVILIGVVLFYWKLHKTIRQVGSFQCRYRPDIHSGWTEGLAVYNTELLSWYRLVSLSTQPAREWSRRGLEVKNVVPCGTDSRGSIVELRVLADGHRFFLEMSEADYTGLVSWAEAGPPRSASFM